VRRPETLAMDLRSIAVFRIAIGLVVLLDFAFRFRERSTFYSDAGILPREVLDNGDLLGYPPHFQLFFLAGAEPALTLLLAVALGCAAALCAGYRPRLMALVCWLMLASLELRNGLTHHAGDRLLLGCLFFAMFLPLGERFSIASYRRRKRGGAPAPHRQVLSPATVGLTLLVFFLYFSAGLYKIVTPSWISGDHLYLTLSRLEYLTPFGETLYSQTWLHRPLTWLTLVVELAVPVLLFVPWRLVAVRVIAITVLAALQVGIGLSLYVGLFPLVSIAASLALLPAGSWCWRRSSGATTEAQSPPARIRWGQFFGTGHMQRLGSAVAVLGATFVIYANVTDHLRVRRLEPAKYVVGEWLGLAQTWNMFQRSPPTGGWITIPATTVDGDTIDLLTGRAHRYERPPRIIDTFKNYRWRILLVNRLRYSTHREFLPPFLDHTCRRWNSEHPAGRRVTKVRFVHHPFVILPDRRRLLLAPEILAVRDCETSDLEGGPR
jgi:hypothetical protein